MDMAAPLPGVVSGMFALLVMYPLDTYKTRRTSGTNGYGVGWYNGLGVGLTSKGVEAYVYHFIYSMLRQKYKNTSVAGDLAIGSVAAACNQLVTLPLSTIQTRMQTSSTATDCLSAIRSIISKGGVSELWSGLRTSLLLVVNPSITSMVFTRLSSWLRYRRVTLTPQVVFLLGAIAKLVATVITYPLILVKTRMQAGTNDKRTKSILQSLRHAMKDNGPLGLYAGMKPKIAQTCLKSAIDFATKDIITKAVKQYVYSKSID